MIGAVKIQVKPEEIIQAIKGMDKRKREAFLEDLIAATSPEYLSSIREARADYKAKRIKTHEEVFGKWTIDSFTPLEVSPFTVEMIKASKVHHRKGGV